MRSAREWRYARQIDATDREMARGWIFARRLRHSGVSARRVRVMQFKIDENLHADAADLLRQHGHDALTVFEQGLR